MSTKPEDEPKREVFANDEQRVFVIPSGAGWSTLGFDNCFRNLEAMAERIGTAVSLPVREEIGTLKQYRDYLAALKLAAGHPRFQETWFTPGTPREVQTLFEDLRRTRRRVLITVGDAETGVAWGDRPEGGTIGRSMGTLKVPLLIRTSRSLGGGAILTDCVVRVQDAATKQDLYRHPTFREAPAPDAAASAEQDAPAPRI